MYQNPIIITGATTSGKSAVAIALAQETARSVLVNMDRTFTIDAFPLGTGYADLRACLVPKRLYGILPAASEPLSIPDYVTYARDTVEDLLARRQQPIFEGGSIEYLKGLIETRDESYSSILGIRLDPSIDLEAQIRKRLNAALEHGLIEEVRQGLEAGLRESHLMKKAIVIVPLIKYLDGVIGLGEVKDEITNQALTYVSRWFEEASKISEIQWIDHHPASMERTLEKIRECIRPAEKKIRITV
ncbi:hypothetical protein HYV86_01610 [Candidatus Woesearchaeota archaeon]|nr:hypothetical protein [Candidatus Woesearchaeota archaeon]